jgi:hypothetical protein
MLRAAAKNVVGGAAKHAAVEADGVGTLEVGERSGWELGSRAKGRVSLHRSFGRREECVSGSGDSIGWWKGWLNGKWTSEGGSRALLQFTEDHLGDEFFLGTELVVVTDGSDSKDAQSVKLRRARNKRRQIRSTVRIVSR